MKHPWVALLGQHRHLNDHGFDNGPPAVHGQVGPDFPQVGGHERHHLAATLAFDPVARFLHAPLNLGTVTLVRRLRDELLGPLVFEPVKQPLVTGELFIERRRRVVLILDGQALPRFALSRLEDGFSDQIVDGISLAVDFTAATNRRAGGAVVNALAPHLADAQLRIAPPALDDAGKEVLGDAPTVVDEAVRVFQDGLDRLPLFHAEDRLEVPWVERPMVQAYADHTGRQQAAPQIGVSPGASTWRLDPALLPVEDDAAQGVSRDDPAGRFA